MKLYATTTSERATKGQGGNDFLDMQIFFKNQSIPKVTIRLHKQLQPIENPFWHLEYQRHGESKWNVIAEFIDDKKGEKKKSDGYVKAQCGHGVDKDTQCEDCDGDIS